MIGSWSPTRVLGLLLLTAAIVLASINAVEPSPASAALQASQDASGSVWSMIYDGQRDRIMSISDTTFLFTFFGVVFFWIVPAIRTWRQRRSGGLRPG